MARPSRFGLLLRELREDADLSRPQLSRKAGGRVSADHIKALELGTRSPSGRTVSDLAQALGVDPVDLLRKAGIVADGPSTPGAHHAEPATVDTWEAIERAINANRDLSRSQKRSLLSVLEPVVQPVLSSAKGRERRKAG